MENEKIKPDMELIALLKALTIGVESAVVLMKKWDQAASEQREHMIYHLNSMVVNSKNYLWRETKTAIISFMIEDK